MAGDRSVQIITMTTFTVIIAMLLLVYRSIITVLLTLTMVVFELAARVEWSRSWLLQDHRALDVRHELVGHVGDRAATDYAIFLIGRYQEARSVGESREDAYYTMYRGTAHVVLGSV